MIQGKKKQETYTVEEIYHLTNGGKDIYTKYVGKIKKGAMKRPWGEDTHPSWGIWQAPDGTWMWKDQAKEEIGGPIQLVQRLFNLDFKQAIDKILFDLGLGDKDIEVARQYIANNQKVERSTIEYARITAKVMKFKERHHQFWNCVGVEESLCKKFNCFAVKELAINRRKVTIGEHEIVFVYFAQDIDKVKLYFPDREGGSRFRTNVPFHHLWNYSNLGDKCDKLIVHKSMKDLITFSQLHPHNVATQNESVKVFTPEIIEKVESVSNEQWLFYGADEDGMKKTKTIIEGTKWKYITTPRDMLPEVNDVYSYVKTHGLRKLEEYCKSKNLL